MNKKNRRFDLPPQNPNPPQNPQQNGHAVPLSDEEQAKIRSAESRIIQLKCALADTELQLREMHDKQEQIVAELRKAGEGFFNEVREVARAHGIDPEDSSKGKWNLDTNTMVFSKVQ